MKLFILLVLFSVVLKFLPAYKKEPQLLQVEEFWRVNGAYANDGEVFEVFYPPLDPLPQ